MKEFFRTLVQKGKPAVRPSQWRELVMIILATGIVAVAVADPNFRQPFFTLAGSILSAYFVVKK